MIQAVLTDIEVEGDSVWVAADGEVVAVEW